MSFEIENGVLKKYIAEDGETSVTIPDNVTSIGESAFFACYNLKEVKIPDSVTSIGYKAFEGCSSFKKVTIKGVTFKPDGKKLSKDYDKAIEMHQMILDAELDEEKVATFATLVNNVVEAEDLAEKWTSIKSALNYYNNLNANEKDAVAANYATLEAEISAYNVGADALNSESKKATEDAIMLLAGTFSILAFAAYFLLRR
jgi:hypothetical protein